MAVQLVVSAWAKLTKRRITERLKITWVKKHFFVSIMSSPLFEFLASLVPKFKKEIPFLGAPHGTKMTNPFISFLILKVKWFRGRLKTLSPSP